LDEVWDDYVTITRNPDRFGPKVISQIVASKWNVRYLLLDAGFHRRTGLLDSIEKSPAWREIGREGNVIVFEYAF